MSPEFSVALVNRDSPWSTWVRVSGDENWTNSRFPGWSIVDILGGYEIRHLGVAVATAGLFTEAVDHIKGEHDEH